jgi:hypothetical protein
MNEMRIVGELENTRDYDEVSETITNSVHASA